MNYIYHIRFDEWLLIGTEVDLKSDGCASWLFFCVSVGNSTSFYRHLDYIPTLGEKGRTKQKIRLYFKNHPTRLEGSADGGLRVFQPTRGLLVIIFSIFL
jgi:hypothetical protein